MSVLIRGMEMPTRCGRCDMCVPEADGDIDWHNVCCITGADIVDVGEKMEDCPLVPVPPHGDLIERDKLREKEFIHDGDAYAVVMSRDIRNAPTIIPACEEVYNKYTDTVGNLYWTGTHSGQHIVRAEEGE